MLLVGDSSTVLRMNVVTGAVTAITNGIPTTVLDTLTGQVTTFSFFRSEWTKGGQVGYIIGRVTVQPRTGPASIRGVVLFSGDGGASWRRQGIVTAPNNGLDFPPVLDIQARSENFATIVGNNGFVARNSGNVASVAACSFNPR